MSRGAYAGQPYTFRCTRCKKGYDYRNDRDRGTYITTTGRIRRQLSQGANYHRWPNHAYEYECKVCGHKGWSRHPNVQRIYRREHTGDISWERIKAFCKEGKRGKLDDVGLAACEDAMKRDPEMYSKVKREADKEVIEEMRSMFG